MIYSTSCTCNTCTNATAAGCLTLTCADHRFDTDGKTRNGCEAGCTTDLPYATCDTCANTTAAGCLTPTCADNHFDTDSKMGNGCEAGCTADLPHAACDACTNATAAGCLTPTCADNRFDTDGKADNGCEAVVRPTCPTPPAAPAMMRLSPAASHWPAPTATLKLMAG